MRVLQHLAATLYFFLAPVSITAWSLPPVTRPRLPFQPKSRGSDNPTISTTRPRSSLWPSRVGTKKEIPFFQLSSSSSSSSNDSSSSALTPPDPNQVAISPLIKTASKKLQRLSWFSWWCQMILTTISTTILVFAASVVRGGTRNAATAAPSAPSFFLSAVAVLISAVSILWTWGNGARLSKRLLRATTMPTAQQHIATARLVRRAVQVQVSINLVGLLITLLAAEEIVGSLAIKVLTTFGVGAANMYNAPLMGLQPLDILVVQANTNTLLAQFISLATTLCLTDQIRILDPPSTLEEPRKRTS